MLPPLSTFPSRPSRGFAGKELRGQYQGGGLLSGQWDEFFQQNVCWGWHWCWKRRGKDLNCGFRGTKDLCWIEVKMGLNQGSNLLELETKQVKRVFSASFGRPDNSWPAAKTWPGLILPGRVTSLGCFSPPVIPILELMYGHSYCGNHVSEEDVVGLMRKAEMNCLYTRYQE